MPRDLRSPIQKGKLNSLFCAIIGNAHALSRSNNSNHTGIFDHLTPRTPPPGAMLEPVTEYEPYGNTGAKKNMPDARTYHCASCQSPYVVFRK